MAASIFSKSTKEEVEDLKKAGEKALQQGLEAYGAYEAEEENYVMLVGETRVRLQPHALDDPPVKELITTLIKWMNDVLENRRIIVRDIAEDLYDGQVLSELIEELSEQKFMTAGVTQSAVLQRAKLKIVLDKIDRFLKIAPDDPDKKWSLDTIHNKDIVSILHLMVTLASYYRCKYPIPQNVTIKRIILKQLENKLETKLFNELITSHDYGPRAPEPSAEKDVFDKLFIEAPDKLEAVKRSLCQFSTKVLQELDITIVDVTNQFHNGTYFILMMGLLEGYFVPLHHYHYRPNVVDDKISNVKLAFKLMEESGLPQNKIKAQDIVEKDLKSILRVLYAIFQKYKSKIHQTQSSSSQSRTSTSVQ